MTTLTPQLHFHQAVTDGLIVDDYRTNNGNGYIVNYMLPLLKNEDGCYHPIVIIKYKTILEVQYNYENHFKELIETLRKHLIVMKHIRKRINFRSINFDHLALEPICCTYKDL